MSKKFTHKNVSVEWKFDLKKTLRDNFSNRQWADLSESVVNNLILRKIEKGLSPVNGVRMFQKYKNPKKYPADLKQNNKPNLTLTGSMLLYYSTKPSNNEMEITIGMQDAPEEEIVKAIANNRGTQSGKDKVASSVKKSSRDRKLQQAAAAIAKGIPARPFIPLKNQTYTRDIILEIRKLFAYCLNQAINRGRNK